MFAYTPNSIPAGVIVFYKGALTAIPSGWHLCDGTNGTDDLRDKMILCAGNTYAVNDTGGVTLHNHANSFTVSENTQIYAVNAGVGGSVPYPDHVHNIGGAITAADGMPPYVAKGFIQKL